MSNRWDKKETVTDYFLGLQNHWERWLLPWNENMLAPWKKSHDKHSILKQRFHFANKVCIVKAMVFPIVMYGCESWTIKKTECQRTDAFKLWCRRRLLRVPWIARQSNQSILKEINPEYSLEGLMLKLKLQYFVHLIWLIGKNPDARKDWGPEEKRATEDEMVVVIINSIDMSWENPGG